MVPVIDRGTIRRRAARNYPERWHIAFAVREKVAPYALHAFRLFVEPGGDGETARPPDQVRHGHRRAVPGESARPLPIADRDRLFTHSSREFCNDRRGSRGSRKLPLGQSENGVAQDLTYCSYAHAGSGVVFSGASTW